MGVFVFTTMGTTASLRFAGRTPEPALLGAIEAVCEHYDARFSLYRIDSELSRVNRGSLALHQASAVLRSSYADGLDWRARTNGAFTPHRPDGAIDLNGIVKAQAMSEAGALLDAAGEADWLLNVGGDIIGRGRIADAPWSIGISDPGDRHGMLCVVQLEHDRRALATSGTAERGEHVWRHDRQHGASVFYRQVSVLAADIVTADVLATAILAGGQDQRDDAIARYPVEVLTVDDAGQITATRGLQRARGLTPA